MVSLVYMLVVTSWLSKGNTEHHNMLPGQKKCHRGGPANIKFVPLNTRLSHSSRCENIEDHDEDCHVQASMLIVLDGPEALTPRDMVVVFHCMCSNMVGRCRSWMEDFPIEQ